MPISDIINSGLVNRATNAKKFNRHERRKAEKELDVLVAKANIPKSPVIMANTLEERLAREQEAKARMDLSRVVSFREKYGDTVEKYSDTELLQSWEAFEKASRGEAFLAWIAYKFPK